MPPDPKEESRKEVFGNGGRERREKALQGGAIDFRIYLNFRQIVGAVIIAAIIWFKKSEPEVTMPNITAIMVLAGALIAPELIGELLAIWKAYRSGK